MSSNELYTREIKANDVLLQDVNDNFLIKSSMAKESIHVYLKLDSVHVRQLHTNQQGFIKFVFGNDLYTTQTRATDKKEKNPDFDLTGEFETEIIIEDLLKTFVKIYLMPLGGDGKSSAYEEPLSMISIDFFTLAFGPIHHAINFRSKGGRSIIGTLQYNITFEQIGETKVLLKNLNISINEMENQAMGTNFRGVTPERKIESNWSNSKVGELNTKELHTNVEFNFYNPNEVKPGALFETSLENMLASSFQIGIWKDRVSSNDQENRLKTILTKQISTAIGASQISISVSDNDSESAPDDSAFNDSADQESQEESDESEIENAVDSSLGDKSMPPTSLNESFESRYHLIGECYIGIVRLLEEQVKYIENSTTGYMTKSNKKLPVNNYNDPEEIKKMMTERETSLDKYKIWNLGRQVGHIEVSFIMKNIPFVRQMQIGVLTETGIAFSSDVSGGATLGLFTTPKSGMPQEMLDIIEYFELVKKRDTTKNGTKKIKQNEIKSKLDQIVALLKKSTK